MSAPAAHALQLFDSHNSLADGVVSFVRDGLARHEAAVVVTTAAQWEIVRKRAAAAGHELEEARAAGHLIVRDADGVLAQVMRHDEPDWVSFDASVGEWLRQLCGTHQRVRLAGGAVDVLVRRNRFDAAERLEEFWSRVMRPLPLEVLCTYSAEHFGNPRDAAALRRICDLHSHVHAAPPDVLGAYLLKAHVAC